MKRGEKWITACQVKVVSMRIEIIEVKKAIKFGEVENAIRAENAES